MVTPPNANIVVAVLLDIIRYACLIAMYGGAIAVMAAVFVMTPETLPPYANREGLVLASPRSNWKASAEGWWRKRNT